MFAEIENGVKEGFSHHSEMPPEAFRISGFSLSGPSCPRVSGSYAVKSAASNTVTNVNLTAGFHDDAPAIQTPPKPTRHPKLNPFALEFHVAKYKAVL